jgi:peptidyl-prolyl cis-trans isomerase D
VLTLLIWQRKYGQTGDANWLTSAQYEGAQIDGDNLKFISAINNAGVNELVNLPMGTSKRNSSGD